MSAIDLKYRARMLAKRKLLELVQKTDPENPQVKLLQNGYVDPSHAGFESIAYQLEKQVSDAPLTFTELTSLSTWFDLHPEKIAGTEMVTSGRFGPTVIVLGDQQTVINTIHGKSASKKDLGIKLKMKLKAKAIKTKLMFTHDTPTAGLSGLSGTDFLSGLGALSPDTAEMLNENSAALKNVISMSRKSLQGLGAAKKNEKPKKTSDIPILSFDTIVEKYNKGLSQDEIIAWVWFKRQIGEKMRGWEKYYLNETFKVTDSGMDLDKGGKLLELVKKGFLFYMGDESNQKIKSLFPYPIYTYGNMYDRILQLEKDKDEIVRLFGNDIYEQHKKAIEAAKPVPLSIMNPDHRERQKILAISKFAKDFQIKELREDSGTEIRTSSNSAEYNEETETYSLIYAFKNWLVDLQEKEKQSFKNVTAMEMWTYYVKGDKMSSRYTEAQQITIEKYAGQECEELFSRFLHEALTVSDQQKFDMLWNRTYNGFSSVPYQRIPIGFECSANFKNGVFEFTPIQREGIAFMKAVGSGIVAYDVGVGKTITAIITLANEMFSGKCSRPLIVVTNGTYKKWIQEIFGFNDDETGEYYSGVLSGTKVTLNDWHNLGTQIAKDLNLNKIVDANSITIVTYEGFVKIGFGSDQASDFINELSLVLDQVKKDDSPPPTAADMEKKYQEWREKIGLGQKKTIADIEVLGFDYIIIDEAHNCKKIFSSVATDDGGKQRFKSGGQKSPPSERGLKAFFLCNYIQRTYGSNVMLLTATPFSNSPTEVYSMISLVGYENMKKMGIINLYSFMELFILQSLEYVNKYDGTIVQQQVVKAFNNRLILQKLIYNNITYKTGEEAGVKRPCKINLPRTSFYDPTTGQTKKLPIKDQATTYLTMNDSQLENQDEINALAQSGGKEAMSNIMKALAGSLDNAFSPFAYSKETPESAIDFVEQSPKIHYTMECIKSIRDYHISRNEPVSNQIIYSNRGKEYFPLIKEYLEEVVGYKKGVLFGRRTIDEVMIISGGIKFEDREFIKEAYQANICKIVIGTAAIREGIDLQKYCTGIFDLYPDWNPTDIKQLEGRGWRQGNTFGYVRVVMPLVQDSMDVFVFQKLEEKTSRINDIWYRADRGNVLDVEALDPDEVKFALFTDVNELSKIVIDKETKDLERQKMTIESNIDSISKVGNAIVKMKDYRQQCVEKIQEWKVALERFSEHVAENIESWEDFPASKMKEYEENSIKYVKEIQEWQSQSAQDDKFIINFSNRIAQSIFRTKSVVGFSSYMFETFKVHFHAVAKAEKTIMQARGYTQESDFKKVEEEMKSEMEKIETAIDSVRSPEHINEIIEQIVFKKSLNKVDGREASSAADDFRKLNHLLQYKFNQTDIEGCKIPVMIEVPKADKPKVQPALALKLKLKAKALRLRLQLKPEARIS